MVSAIADCKSDLPGATSVERVKLLMLQLFATDQTPPSSLSLPADTARPRLSPRQTHRILELLIWRSKVVQGRGGA